jgi:multidrug efflux system outer membrane protein
MRRAALIIAFAAALGLLAGCMVGPDYVRPTVDVPEAFRFDGGGTQGASDAVWWSQFGDPVLDALIAEALANNRNVKIAAANVEQAAGFLMTARAGLFPQVAYGGAQTRQRMSQNDATFSPLMQNPYNSLQAFGGVSWEIDLWGRVRRLTEAARASLLASVEARRGVIVSVVAETAAAYIQLRSLDEQLAISRRTLETYAESVRLFELQNKYGQVNRMTVEQARTQYETAAVTIPQIETQIAETENGLCLLLGRNPGPIARGRTVYTLAMPVVPAGLPSQLLERRPDIRQAEAALVAANAQIGAAKALYYPTISLTGAYGRSSSELSNLWSGPSRIWSYGGSLAGPIFTGGAIAGQVKQAEAGRDAALLSYAQTIQNAFADVDNALIARRKLEEQLAAEERRVAAFKEYDRLARLQYVGGYIPYLTVLYAEAQLFPAELSAIQTRAAAFISLINIYKATGGGWVAAAEGATGQGAGSGEKEGKQKAE